MPDHEIESQSVPEPDDADGWDDWDDPLGDPLGDPVPAVKPPKASGPPPPPPPPKSR